MCNNRLPGPLRADAFRGHGFSLSGRKPLPTSLQTRAVPAGVIALRSPGLVTATTFFSWIPLLEVREAILAEEIHVDSCGIRDQSETLKNGVQGGSRVARGKRSVIP